MKENSTDITVILDRSGSMEDIRDDTIGGFNAFLEEQRAQPCETTLTLVQFDTQDAYEVIHRLAALGGVAALTRETYVPRAGTPLLDALGRGINDLESSLAAMPEDDRPAKIILVVVTDGQENSSHEFRREQIEQMIQARTEGDHWQFVFLSADLAAIRDATSVGVKLDAVLLFEKTSKSNPDAWGALSRRTSDYRANRKTRIAFEDEDRQHPDDPGKRLP